MPRGWSSLRALWAVALGALALQPGHAHAQAAAPCCTVAGRPLELTATAFGTASTAATLPFWLTANRYGLTGETAGAGLHLAATLPDQATGHFGTTVGGALVGRAAAESASTTHLHEGYVRVRYGPATVSAGLWRQVAGRHDEHLSAGSTTWSANAPPLPRVSLAVAPVDLPLTAGWLRLSGTLAHGWLTEDRFITEAQLHEKSAYLDVGRPSAAVQGYAGLIHHVIWGGVHPTQGAMPTRWFDVVTGANKGDHRNGNGVAMWDVGITVRRSSLGLTLYRQFYQEDSTFDYQRNWKDGLWGLRLHGLQRPWLTALLYEYVDLLWQGARTEQGEQRGADNYYNHAFYLDGWTYQGQVLGSPLARTDRAFRGVVNNIVVAHHLGAMGELAPAWRYRLLLTYSRNYGAAGLLRSDAQSVADRVPGRTARRDQGAALLEVTGPLAPQAGLYLQAGLGLNSGAAYADGLGLLLGVQWRSESGSR
ncbi:MAG: capsule assembly Wzi family protein [Bacteroidota bacterium]